MTEKQLMDIESYIELVRNVGIERAYKERYRQTGRTVRDILFLATAISEGRKVFLIADGKEHRYDRVQYVIKNIAILCRDVLNMKINTTKSIIEYPPSGGFVALVPNASILPSNAEVYRLHDF